MANQQNQSTSAMPPEIADAVQQAQKLLQAGDPAKALDLLSRVKGRSPWLTNAMAVCHLRLGNSQAAVDILRGLVLASGGVVMRADMPTVFKVNFAAALLSIGNQGGCQSVLSEIGPGHPSADRLRACIDRWRNSLTLWEKFSWYMGGQPDRPVSLDFIPGELE